MGGSPSGKTDSTTPGYEQMHTDIHTMLMTGQDSEGNLDLKGDADNFVQLDKLQGIAGMFSDILSHNLGTTPFAEAEFYHASGLTEPLADLMTKTTAFQVAMEAVNVTTDWTSDYTAIKAVVLDSTSIDAAADAFEAEQVDVLDRSIGRINASFSNIDAVNSSSRVMAVTHAESGHDKSVATFRTNMKLGREGIAIDVSTGLSEQKRRSEVSRINAISNLMNGVNLYIAASRNEREDELRLDVEDTLWDLKAADFPARIFQSISGATMVPVSTHSEQKGGGGLSSVLGIAATAAAFVVGGPAAGAGVAAVAGVSS